MSKTTRTTALERRARQLELGLRGLISLPRGKVRHHVDSPRRQPEDDGPGYVVGSGSAACGKWIVGKLVSWGNGRQCRSCVRELERRRDHALRR